MLRSRIWVVFTATVLVLVVATCAQASGEEGVAQVQGQPEQAVLEDQLLTELKQLTNEQIEQLLMMLMKQNAEANRQGQLRQRAAQQPQLRRLPAVRQLPVQLRMQQRIASQKLRQRAAQQQQIQLRRQAAQQSPLQLRQRLLQQRQLPNGRGITNAKMIELLIMLKAR